LRDAWRNIWRFLAILGLAMIVLGTSPSEAEAKRRTHKVSKGDTLSRIAARYGIRLRALKRLNRLKEDHIRIGQRLRLPKNARLRDKAPIRKRVKMVTHRVRPGEFLGSIAKAYGCTVKDIVRRNRLKNRNSVRVGMKLRIPAKKPKLELCPKVYRVQPGDSISQIKKRFKVSTMELLYHNPRIKDLNRIRIGQKIRIVKECPPAESISQSVGRTNSGRLVNGTRLPCGKQYAWHCRTPRKSWGTKETVNGIMDAVDAVNAAFPRTHRVTIEHISAEKGGYLSPHKSHQSGRDVDIGYYFKKQGYAGPKRFLDATKHALDYPRTWALLRALISPVNNAHRAQYIFCDYKVQELMVRWAKRKGKSAKMLKKMFQYPSGRRKLTGIIRHVKGHKGHLHVRFVCPKDDKDCKR
jgi:LysM repeat protein